MHLIGLFQPALREMEANTTKNENMLSSKNRYFFFFFFFFFGSIYEDALVVFQITPATGIRTLLRPGN